ncbi:MAG: formylglycine-generating enzyme family protein [Acidobacteria bacterium]|nr:formylglycine-generating enzyme family protein [Acidobacteriota bacterium]
MHLFRLAWLALLLSCVAGELSAESIRTAEASVARILSSEKIVLQTAEPHRLVGRHGDIHYDVIANGRRRRVVPAKVIVLDVIGENEVLAELFDARGAIRPGYRVTFLLPVSGPASDHPSSPMDQKTGGETASAPVTAAPSARADNPSQPPAAPATEPPARPPRPDNIMQQLERMVYIPGGAATIGVGDRQARFWNESPAHQVTIAPFYMDRHEVTCAEYARFLQATGHPRPADWPGDHAPAGRENIPVTHVSWYDAAAFAQWCGKRLPTEDEWEFAGRGQRQWLYPWGNAYHPEAANSQEADTGGPRPVGSRPKDQSYYGIYDLAGNVSEWTASPYHPFPGNRHPEKEYTQDRRVVRGGAFSVTSVYCRLVFRAHLPPQYAAADLGFRCVIGEAEVAFRQRNTNQKETTRD